MGPGAEIDGPGARRGVRATLLTQPFVDHPCSVTPGQKTAQGKTFGEGEDSSVIVMVKKCDRRFNDWQKTFGALVMKGIVERFHKFGL